LTIILDTAGQKFPFHAHESTQLLSRRFALAEEEKADAIPCDSKCGPHFGKIMFTDVFQENADGSMSGSAMFRPTTRDSLSRDLENFNLRPLEIFQTPGKCLSCCRFAETRRLLS
jgi:hypothetical protein